MNKIQVAIRLCKHVLFSLAFISGVAGAAEQEPIVIGLDADMSAGSAQGGDAIRRGALIAIAEINERGGLLGGRPLDLQVKDHRGTPTRSTDNLLEFAATKNLVAVLGGLHSPAIIQNHKLIHDQRLIMLVPWSAATAVIDGASNPSYVFRISVRDELAGGFLTEEAMKRGHRRLGLLLEQTAWGRGNEASIKAALAKKGLEPAAVQWFNLGETDLIPAILALESAGADAILMVANAPEGAAAVTALANRPSGRRLPVFSHWGITGGRFVELTGDALRKVDLSVLQTYSFVNATRKQARAVQQRYRQMFGVARPEEIPAPVGTAQAYDLVHVLALAIKKAGTVERSEVRSAMENINAYSGLIRNYQPPFTATRHEGLSRADYRLARYSSNGNLIPATPGNR